MTAAEKVALMVVVPVLALLVLAIAAWSRQGRR
jgi:hypothetical protein